MSTPADTPGVTDPATQHALARLAATREQLADWLEAALQPRPVAGSGSPLRAALFNALLFLGRQPLPWLRWTLSALVLLRSLRRRRRH